MVIVSVLIWLGSAGLAYIFTGGAALCYRRRAWDRPMREFAFVCGPLLAAVGKGLGAGTPQRYFRGPSHVHD